MESEAGRIRKQLGPLGLGLVLACGLLGLDVWLGYLKMVHGNSDEQIEHVHAPHPRLGWVPEPGIGHHARPGNFAVDYGIDVDGLRRVVDDRDEVDDGVAGATLWLFGDSFTFGHGVSDADTFASVMARDWLTPEIRVRNAGVMGYGIAQEVQRLVELADRIQPGDRVVFTPISVGVERSLEHFAHPSRYLFRQEKGRISGYPTLRHHQLVVAPFDTPGNRLRALLYNARFTGPGLQRLHHLLSPPHTIENTRELMQIARRISEERGARFGWLFLPQPRECLADGYRVDLTGLEFRDLKRFCPSDPEGVQSIRFPEDPHWNARGHALAARAVVETLLESGLLASHEIAVDPNLAERRGG